MAKFDPLEQYLLRCYQQGQRIVTLTFAQIDQMIIRPGVPRGLEDSAYTHRPYWANETNPNTRHYICRAWRNAGYFVDSVNQVPHNPNASWVRFRM